MIRIFLILCVIFMSYGVVNAHEVRPAFLKLTETDEAKFSVIWKQPILSGKRLKLTPIFPESCTQSKTQLNYGSLTIIKQFDIGCNLKTGMITVDGLERTITDVFVEIHYINGEVRQKLLKPYDISFNLSNHEARSTLQISHYLRIGIDHILFGWDHLLFVIGLVLLVSHRQIIGVATAFTVAHSFTLALAVFGLINLPSRPVEILIAASIIVLAFEIIKKRQGQTSLAAQRPYLVSFLIGLIHGCGFASALTDIGLPKNTEIYALFMFNLGVELGQAIVIIMLVAFFMILSRLYLNRHKIVELSMTYIIGGVALFWVIDRAKDYIV